MFQIVQLDDTKFMDLLFKRYASPFLLLDQYIHSCRLAEFIDALVDVQNEELMWETWLHKVLDKSFDEFKEDVAAQVRSSKQSDEMTNEQIEATVHRSNHILDEFHPQ